MRTRNEITILETERQRVFDLHRHGKYTDDEFLEQKRLINTRIDEKHLLLKDKRVEEFNMEEALEFCFNTVRNSSATWLKYANDSERRLQFQNFIFKENVPFSGEKFETTELTPIYSIYQQYLADPSKLVTLQGIEP